MWSTSQSNHAGSRSCGDSSGETPRSEAIVRSPAAASETTTPVRPSAAPQTSTPCSRSAWASSSPVASSPRRPTSRACGAELRRPRRDVCRLAARPRLGARHLVVAGDERPVEPHDHVEQEVAEGREPHRYHRRMDGSDRRTKLRSFAIGGVLGAAGRHRDRPPLVARASAPRSTGLPRSRTLRATWSSSAARRRPVRRTRRSGRP